jgi:hypothetical protein
MSWLRSATKAKPPRSSRLGDHAPNVVGIDPDGNARDLAFGPGRTTLLFLTSSCRACQGFWQQLAADPSLPGGTAVAITTPGAALESRRQVAELAPAAVDVVMSAAAWQDYGVSGSPFAVVISDGMVAAEAPVSDWAELTALLER